MRVREGSVISVKGMRGQKKWLVVECDEPFEWNETDPFAPLVWFGCRPVVTMTAKRRNDPWLERMALTDAEGNKVYVGEQYWSGCSLSDIERVIRY